ncbi:UNVERIFIED_CONTAM: hypothetical protein HDU68_005202 [Siphonaria sp. JEL0065]|nr:hypothetical protein HDU68_005202 [Siphonaria sp. JEL0065]
MREVYKHGKHLSRHHAQSAKRFSDLSLKQTPAIRNRSLKTPFRHEPPQNNNNHQNNAQPHTFRHAVTAPVALKALEYPSPSTNCLSAFTRLEEEALRILNMCSTMWYPDIGQYCAIGAAASSCDTNRATQLPGLYPLEIDTATYYTVQQPTIDNNVDEKDQIVSDEIALLIDDMTPSVIHSPTVDDIVAEKLLTDLSSSTMLMMMTMLSHGPGVGVLAGSEYSCVVETEEEESLANIEQTLDPQLIIDVPVVNHDDLESVDDDAGDQPGQLTDKGKNTLVALGNSIREEYTDALSFLPQFLTPHFNKHNIYVRSTGYVRTIESVQYLLGGLFPFQTRELGPSSEITIHVKADENMYIDMKCEKLMNLVKPFRKAVEERHSAVTTKLMQKFVDAFPEDAKKKDIEEIVLSTPGEFQTTEKKKEEAGNTGKRFDIREIDTFYDTFKAMKAADVPFPKGVDGTSITDKDMDLLGKVFMEGFLGGLFIGDLLEVMHTRVQKPLNDPYGIKLGLFSGHDTTIGPLLVGLGLFRGELRAWPKFGAHVTFELFEQQQQAIAVSTNDRKEFEHFVRVRYNGVPQKLDFCQAKG